MNGTDYHNFSFPLHYEGGGGVKKKWPLAICTANVGMDVIHSLVSKVKRINFQVLVSPCCDVIND